MARIYHTWHGFYPSMFSNTASFAQSSTFRIDNITLFGSIQPGDSWCVSFWNKCPSSFFGLFESFRQSVGPGQGAFFLQHLSPYLIFNHFAYDGVALKRNRLWTNGTVGGLRDGNWHHISIVASNYSWDINDLTLYVDGVDVGVVLSSELTALTPAWTPAATGRILSASNPGPYLFDEFAFFNYSPSISDLYNGGTPGNLGSLATPPLNWARGENNLTDSGTLADVLTAPFSPIYSTDVP
jgi:hypothetical protein